MLFRKKSTFESDLGYAWSHYNSPFFLFSKYQRRREDIFRKVFAWFFCGSVEPTKLLLPREKIKGLFIVNSTDTYNRKQTNNQCIKESQIMIVSFCVFQIQIVIVNTSIGKFRTLDIPTGGQTLVKSFFMQTQRVQAWFLSRIIWKIILIADTIQFTEEIPRLPP